MKFDLVVGNPPYTDTLDLEFESCAYDISKKYVNLVVPAKWYLGNYFIKNKNLSCQQVRDKFLPHLKDLVFIPRSNQVFNAAIHSGVCYFLVDKDNNYDKTLVKNYFDCYYDKKKKGLVDYEDSAYRKLTGEEPLLNCALSIIEKCSKPERFSIKDYRGLGYTYYVEGRDTTPAWQHYGLDRTNCPYFMSTLNIIESEKFIPQASKLVFFSSDSIDECKSYVSYSYSKLFRFLYMCGMYNFHGHSSANGNNHAFRFTPVPYAGYSVIYTDDMLFNHYGITQNEVDIIDAFIRERTFEELKEAIKVQNNKGV